jgi:hypothetical protein
MFTLPYLPSYDTGNSFIDMAGLLYIVLDRKINIQYNYNIKEFLIWITLKKLKR